MTAERTSELACSIAEIDAMDKRKGLWMGGNVPLGYQADGRTLKIDDGEAETIRKLYELYRAHTTIREVKYRAEGLGLRSRRRERSGGRVSGGGSFDRGHIHHILSNPIYAGHIRHKGQVYEGQHPAIIEPESWDGVQRLLETGAAKTRGSKQKASRSPLTGKLFDETGDRLTPSHTKKNGKRLRYYISRRLVTERSRKHPDAWRLPAEEVEYLLSKVIRQYLGRPDAVSTVMQGASAVDILAAKKNLESLNRTKEILILIGRADLKPGSLTLQLDGQTLAQFLECQPDLINASALTIQAPFRMRRRGVELKLHLGDAAPQVDQTLVRNIEKARRWMAKIIKGATFADITAAETTSTRRVQQVVELALLTPETLDAIATGTQPEGLTTDYLLKTGFGPVWSEQQAQFADL